MNERNKELAIAAGIYTNQSKMLETFADLIRADTMEAATRAANQSWMLLAKSMIAAEREACAEVADSMDSLQDGAIGKAIRARSQP